MSNAVTRHSSVTEQQLRFAEEYLVDLDGKAAAIRAGCASGSAAVQANRLLNNVSVATVISNMLELRSERTQFTQDQVLRELAQLGMSNIINYRIDDDGNVSVAEGADSECMKAVKSVKRTLKYDKDGNKIIETEVQLWDKVSALKMMAKHLGMLVDVHLVGGTINHEHRQTWNFGGREITF
jgi:phage terminase small subunit